MNFAQRMNRLGTENAFEVLAEVKKLEAMGKDIISFAIGEPDFNTPEHIKEACIKAIRDNHTHYGPSAGILALREMIAEYITKTRKLPCHSDEVVVTAGAKPIIYFVIHALVNPGDEVIYPTPGFPIYESVINFVGGVPVPAVLLEEHSFTFDIDSLRELVTPKTKLIILNSPQNPTGGMLTKKDLEAIAELAISNDLWVLADEIYSRIVYDGDFVSISSIPGMKDRTIILDGFSKTYAMTGWRIGYGVMNETLARYITRLVMNSESCTNTFIQHAAIAALTGPQNDVQAMVQEFHARRDLIVDGLNSIKGIHCQVPKGAFYVFPNVTEACRNLGLETGKDLQHHLLYNAHVAVLPRTSFGAKDNREIGEFVRFSYATSRENIELGLKRIKEALER